MNDTFLLMKCLKASLMRCVHDLAGILDKYRAYCVIESLVFANIINRRERYNFHLEARSARNTISAENVFIIYLRSAAVAAYCIESELISYLVFNRRTLNHEQRNLCATFCSLIKLIDDFRLRFA